MDRRDLLCHEPGGPDPSRHQPASGKTSWKRRSEATVPRADPPRRYGIDKRDGARGPSLGGVSLALAAAAARDLGRALAAVHSAGLAHLDVKPDNVVVDAARTRCVLCDLGSARGADDRAVDSP